MIAKTRESSQKQNLTTDKRGSGKANHPFDRLRAGYGHEGSQRKKALRFRSAFIYQITKLLNYQI